MSLFIGNSTQYSYAQVDPEKVKMAEIQFNATAHTFNKLLSRCQAKCIGHKYGEGELNTGESSCIDRCVAKYVTANYQIGQHFQENGINPYDAMRQYDGVKKIGKEEK